MDYLEKLKNDCSYPIDYVSMANWIGGAFGGSDCIIEINNNCNSIDQEISLVHELGHARCHKRKCICYRTDNTELKEVHANIFTLRTLLKNERKETLAREIECLEWTSGQKLREYHQRAAVRTMNTRLWKRCKEYVGLS